MKQVDKQDLKISASLVQYMIKSSSFRFYKENRTLRKKNLSYRLRPSENFCVLHFEVMQMHRVAEAEIVKPIAFKIFAITLKI